MESDEQPEFEPSFLASLRQPVWDSEVDLRHEVRLTADRILIADGPTTTEIPLDDIQRIDIVLLSVEPYWFLANSVGFLPLMYTRPMLRLTVGKEHRTIDLRAERRDLAYATFVEFLARRALTRTPRIGVMVRTAPRAELKWGVPAAAVGIFLLGGWFGAAIYVGALAAPFVLASIAVRRLTAREVTRVEEVFPFIV